MAYNKKAHLRDNIETIRIAFALDKEKRQATDDEKIKLAAYSGFGGIKAVLNPAANRKIYNIGKPRSMICSLW